MTYLIRGIRPRAFLSIISLLASIFIHSAALAESRLILLGNFPAVEEGQADALSDDGAVVTGSSGSKAFRWENEADGNSVVGMVTDEALSGTTEPYLLLSPMTWYMRTGSNSGYVKAFDSICYDS